jgi:hypothetical protein
MKGAQIGSQRDRPFKVEPLIRCLAARSVYRVLGTSS